MHPWRLWRMVAIILVSLVLLTFLTTSQVNLGSLGYGMIVWRNPIYQEHPYGCLYSMELVSQVRTTELLRLSVGYWRGWRLPDGTRSLLNDHVVASAYPFPVMVPHAGFGIDFIIPFIHFGSGAGCFV